MGILDDERKGIKQVKSNYSKKKSTQIRRILYKEENIEVVWFIWNFIVVRRQG